MFNWLKRLIGGAIARKQAQERLDAGQPQHTANRDGKLTLDPGNTPGIS